MKKRVVTEVATGQLWRDRDPRMWSGNRRVRVVSADPHGFVIYRHVVGADNREETRTFASRYQRFQYAFELIDASGRPQAHS